MLYTLPKGSEEARKKVCGLINDLSFEKAWQVQVRPYKKKCSSAQRGYYWGVIIKILSEETGNEANDLHEYLLGEAFGWDTYEVMGKPRVRPARRSSELDVSETSAYHEWCRMWANRELGILIPEPNEVIT